MRPVFLLLGTLITSALSLSPVRGAPENGKASRWWEPYEGAEANGPDVLGFWRFDEEQAVGKDSGPHELEGVLRGASWSGERRFGKGGLRGGAGYPVIDDPHGFIVKRSPFLSPDGAFSLEMWLRPDAGEDAFPPEVSPVLADCKYVRDNHSGFTWTLLRQSKAGTRQFQLEIGLGARTERWYSEPLKLDAEAWQHVAFTYDGIGTVTFFLDGAEIGRSIRPGAGSMAAAIRDLSLGDRNGSLYHGFPGLIDEIRFSKGVREFRPTRVTTEAERPAFLRMSEGATIPIKLENLSAAPLESLAITLRIPGAAKEQAETLASLGPGAVHRIDVPVDTSLRPGEYVIDLTVEAPGWGGEGASYATNARLPFTVVSRPLPNRMPVVMWGLGGTEGVLKEISRLKDLGFTHCLGLRTDYGAIWEKGEAALPAEPEEIYAARDMLDRALENDLGIIATVAPGRWLRTAEVGKPFLRIDREGTHYGREDISGLFPRVQQFCFDTGAALGRAYGDHPAFAAALLHTEVRGESQVSFHPIEREAAEKAIGGKIPDEVTIKNGIDYRKLPDFPENRVIKDDDPILSYLRWFWTEGDGWNELNTKLDQGLKSEIGRDDFWTFHDPAVRVPSIHGSGGSADVLAHWTYSYPDPIRIGLCTDELFEMARVNGLGQEVMKMTQVIWYRSQTAPEKAPDGIEVSPWVDQDPDAAYITIAPMHLREAFWWKIARPIKGIMYHGWGSLVESDSPSSYRFTNPNTAGELRRLVKEVVEPLGPTLLQVPDAPSDVAFLESFTSQMFARRGTYGWNHRWAGDLYHVLMWAQLQPRVLYEESLLAEDGLDGVKLLVMGDCDVLAESVVRKVKAFQEAGGIVIGDEELCPAIRPDVVVPRYDRTKQAAEDKSALQERAEKLRVDLAGKYDWPLASDNPDVVTRRRVSGSSDYVFAVNDHREAGTYVGNYGMVMENGLPSKAKLRLRRQGGHVYDLTRQQEVTAIDRGEGNMEIPLELGPAEGRILLVTDRPVAGMVIAAPVEISADESNIVPVGVSAGESITVGVAVIDLWGDPIDAVIPLEVSIVDPEGVLAEGSGFYGAAGGKLDLRLDIASNDRPGMWEISVREGATGRESRVYFRVRNEGNR